MITISRKAICCLILVMIYEKCQMAPPDENDGDSSRIVNGSKATPGQFPFAVSLQEFYNPKFEKHYHKCTLSLITMKTCLGAAHCAVRKGKPMPVEKFCGRVGTIDQTQMIFCHYFSNIFIHEDYKRDRENNDVATFIFVDEIKCFDKKLADIVPLIGAGGIIKEDVVTALGWGHMHNRTYHDDPKTLRYVELNLLPDWKCSKENDNRLHFY